MPEREIEEACSGVLDLMDIWYRVFAYMIWPEDEERRRVHIATAFIGGLDALETVERPKDLQPEFFDMARQLAGDALMNNLKELVGGFSSLRILSGIPRPREDLPVKEWRTAATVLFLIRAIEAHSPGTASLNKAIFLIVNDNRKYQCLKNSTYVKRAWTKYKNVSHFAAALFIWLPMGLEFDPVGLAEFLAIVRDFQMFGMSFSWNKKEPLLDPSKIWSVPEDLPLPECPAGIIPVLDQEEIAALRKYRAPQ